MISQIKKRLHKPKIRRLGHMRITGKNTDDIRPRYFGFDLLKTGMSEVSKGLNDLNLITHNFSYLKLNLKH